MAKITKSLSAVINKSTGKSEILFRFIANREKVYRLKSGLFVSPNNWSVKNKDLKKLSIDREQSELIKKLSNLENRIFEKFGEKEIDKVNSDWLNEVIHDFHFPKVVEVVKLDFFDLFDKYIESSKLAENRKRHFIVVQFALKRWVMYRQITEHTDFRINYDDFKAKDLDLFEKFIRNEHNLFDEYPEIYKAFPETRRPKQRGKNTIAGYFKKIRIFWLWMIKKEKCTTNDPFDGYDMISERYGDPIYITVEERNKLFYTDLSKHPITEIQRDIFVFQCLVGCRVSDFQKFTTENIKRNDNNLFLEYIASKTKEEEPVVVRVPLVQKARELLAKYENVDEKGRLFPFVSYTDYLTEIKKLFRLAGITRKVTRLNSITGEVEQVPINEIAGTHFARKTFIGGLYKKLKDPKIISSMSGHSENSRAFNRYRTIDDDIKISAITEIE